MNYSILEWSRCVNLHDSIPPPEAVKMGRTSDPFALIIEGVETNGGSPTPIDDLMFSITLYHTRTQSFYGRTYVFNGDLAVFYHSKVTDEEALAVVEIIKLDPNNPVKKNLLGWAKVFCYNERPSEKAPIFLGSSRSLLLGQQPTALGQGTALVYTVRFYPELAAIYSIVPPDTFFGSQEILPGVKGKKIQINQKILMEKTGNMTIEGIEIHQGLEIEQKVLAFAEKYQKEKFFNTNPKRPNILERRILVGTHNTWTYIGNNGPESVAVLRPEDTRLVSSSIISVKDTFEDEMVAVVFELQYILLIPKKMGESDEQITINVSWAPHVGDKEGRYEVGMISGPGRSISGKMLWDISIDLEIEFSLSMSGFAHRPSNNEIVEAPPDMSKLLRENDRKLMIERQRMQDEMNRLKDELIRERNRPKDAPMIIPVPQPEIPSPKKQVVESSSQTHFFEPPKIDPEPPVLPAYQNPPDYSYLDALQPSMPTDAVGKISAEPLPKNISRADKARLVRSGVRGLLENNYLYSQYSPRLDVEASDPLKASNFTIHFLAYRQMGGKKRLPEKICFGLRFYNFPHQIHEPAFIKIADVGVPWMIEKLAGSPEMVIRYEIETCIWDVVDFAKYLMKKFLTIEVWDTQSHMILGYIKIPLIELMRQGRPNVSVTKEYPVVEEIGGDQFGSIQILLRNVGILSTSKLQPSQNPLKIQSGQARHKSRIRAKPLVLSSSDPPLPMGNDENRKRLRVLEFKKSMKKPGDEFWEQEKMLSEIAMVRESLKPIVIKQALREYMSNAEKLFVRPGQAIVFQFSIHNPHAFEECFTFNISDEDLQLIKGPNEWLWWANNLNFDKPIDYESISEDNSLVLRSGETLPVLFKYHSWNPTKKLISIWVNQSQGSPLCALELEVVPESCPVDRVFHFYECENRTVRLHLPPLFTSSVSSKPVIFCSLAKTVINWEAENEISVEIKVPEAPKCQVFYIVAFENHYCQEITANWEVRLHSLVGMDVSVNMGQNTSIRITCPGDEARTVTLFSSFPEVVFFPPPHNKPFTLMPRTVNNLPVIVRSDSLLPQSVRVHCVDVFHKVLVHAWVFKIQTTGQNVTQQFDLKCPMNVMTEKKVAFVNRSQTFAIFHFRSSNVRILEIRENKIALEGGAKGYLGILIKPPPVPSLAEVSVFANDTEESIFESMMFKIDFCP
jgi:hypothetical protein